MLVAGTALLVFAMLAVLWHWGPHSVYFRILDLFSFEPFRFPFLDIQVVLAAAECSRQGFDVYLFNPCDALVRPLGYSPLWLRITPGFLNTNATTAVGFGLGLTFIASLAATCRPSTWREAVALLLTALSPMVVYALERANADIAVFLLILAGCALGRTPRPWRFGACALYLLAGLLKYYPLILIVLIAGERRRDIFVIGTIVGCLLLLLVLGDRAELAEALANIPSPSYFTDSFSAINLPFGVAEIVGGGRLAGLFGVLLLVVLVGLAGARTRRTLLLFGRSPPDWAPFEAQGLLVGALVLIGCFFAGQNIDYRGIYFVLVVPGVLRLCRAARMANTRRFLRQVIAAILFVVWEPVWRRGVQAAVLALPTEALRMPAEILFWIGRELVWWWLITGLAAIVLCYLRGQPLVLDLVSVLPKLDPSRRRDLPG